MKSVHISELTWPDYDVKVRDGRTPVLIPVGAAARTVLGKIEIVLFRSGEEDYRVECWRSFSPYAFGLLVEGAEDAGL